MLRPRVAALAGIVGAALGLASLVAPAAAHPWFDLGSVPADSDQRLQLRVPTEASRQTTRNTLVRLSVPRSFEVLECLAPAGWDCGVFDEGAAGTTVEWEADTALPAEAFDVLVHTPDAVGRYAMPVEQHRSDDSVVRWSGSPGAAQPAPAVAVSAAGPPVPNTAIPAPHPPTTAPDDTEPTTPSVGPPPPSGGGGVGSPTSPSVPAGTTTPTTPPRDGGSAAPSLEPEIPADVPPSIPRDPTARDSPSSDGPPPMGLTAGRVVLGLAALLGAVVLRLLVRRASPLT